MERVGGRQEKMEGHCSTGQSPQWAVVPMEEEEEEEEEEVIDVIIVTFFISLFPSLSCFFSSSISLFLPSISFKPFCPLSRCV